MINPLDSRGKTILVGDEVKYKNSIFTVADLVSDSVIVAETDKGKPYHLKSDQTTRMFRPLHVSRML